MQRIPGADAWLLISIQGLHRFYQRRTDAVVASWMTRQDRELAIADNVGYVKTVIAAVEEEYPAPSRLVFTGFSQGVAMMFRAATAAPRAVDGVIAAGGDVPPEIAATALARVSNALVCRGTGDEWYTDAIFQRDVQRLREAGVTVEAQAFDGGHEWSAAVVQAAAIFLRERRR
jgi:predicted esterase